MEKEEKRHTENRKRQNGFPIFPQKGDSFPRKKIKGRRTAAHYQQKLADMETGGSATGKGNPTKEPPTLKIDHQALAVLRSRKMATENAEDLAVSSREGRGDHEGHPIAP